MSKLIQLRQRIKAIETIKKITHAMRLISMSIHTHLKRNEKGIIEYVQALDTLLATLKHQVPDWKNPIVYPRKQAQPQTLIILIGSQKGLCGSFNLNLFKLCNVCMKDVPQFQGKHDFIAVGQKAVDFLHTSNLKPVIKKFEKFSPHTLLAIAREITHYILDTVPHYSSVIILSNEFKSFFNQKPTAFTLIPFSNESTNSSALSEDILWPEPPEKLLNEFVHQYIEGQIHFKLFESLLAEHAARFVSMDTATQNADGLLDAAKLEYNKMRQAKITKELTELSASYE